MPDDYGASIQRLARSPFPAGPLGKQRGEKTPGNINLSTRPMVPNSGKTSTVNSASFYFDGIGEVLLPTVSDDGRLLTDQQAIEQFKRTGKHLGIFETPMDASGYAKRLHEQQAKFYGL